jgi:Ca2+-binding EF-hand superfamily protein
MLIALDNSNRTTERETSFQEAAAIATQVFRNIDHEQKGYISYEDFLPFFKKESEARRAFELFDRDGNGQVTLEETVKMVYRIFKDRKALFITLHDRENIASILVSKPF